MHILLTGASGFIGSHILTALLRAGHSVTIPVRKESIQKLLHQPSTPQLQLIKGEFWEPRRWMEQLKKPVDAILHFAALRGEGKAKPAVYQRVNVEGTANLLALGQQLNIPRFLYCSSVGVLGTIPKIQPAAPDLPYAADGLYHQTKMQSELLVRQAAANHLKTLILRPTIAYGHGDDGFLPRLQGMVQRGYFPLCRSESQVHLLDVHSFAALVGQVLGKDIFNNATYHVADAQPVGLAELTKLITQFTNGRFLLLPSFMFRFGKLLAAITGQSGLKTSLQLISDDWTYDISKTIEDLHYEPHNTMEVLSEQFKEIQ